MSVKLQKYSVETWKKNKIINYFFERFGIDPEYFINKNLIVRGNAFWMTTAEISDSLLNVFEFERAGIRIARGEVSEDKILIKPTSTFLQLLGTRITENVMQLQKEELKLFFSREVFTPKEMQLNEFSSGYVAMKFKGNVLGCARITRPYLENDEQVKKFISEFPKKLCQNMKIAQLAR